MSSGYHKIYGVDLKIVTHAIYLTTTCLSIQFLINKNNTEGCASENLRGVRCYATLQHTQSRPTANRKDGKGGNADCHPKCTLLEKSRAFGMISDFVRKIPVD